MGLRPAVIGLALLGACGDRASGSDRAPLARVTMRWPSTGDVVASPRPRVRWSAPASSARVRLTFCADRACARVIESLETDGRALQPSRPLPTGVIFWRVHEVLAEVEPSGPVWWFLVPRAAREAPERTSRDLGWSPIRDVDGDGDWDPLDLHGALTERAGDRRVVRTWLGDQGAAPVVAVGDVDGDGYVDFAGADPLRTSQIGRVLVWRGPLARGEVAPWRAGTVGASGGARCGWWPTLSGDFDGDGRRELAVTCPAALDGRGEVRVVALEGEGLGRTLTTLRGSGNGFHTTAAFADAGARALVAEDLDDDGYDDLVVGAGDARCEWVPDTRSCAVNPWLGVYLGGPGGLVGRVALTLPIPETEPGQRLAGASAAVFDAADGTRQLAVGAGPLLWLHVTSTPTLALDARVFAREQTQAADFLLALPRADRGDTLLTSDGSAWYEITREGAASATWRRLQSPAAPWQTALAEVADVQGDGVPDLVVHATAGTPQRAVIFTALADADGRVEAMTQRTE